MKTLVAVMSTLVSLLLAVTLGFTALGECHCNRPYSELTLNPGEPFNAVGFLNNGCTAFLIDENHIVAAAHCFENTSTGAWQTGLRFYPNFHPDRVTVDAHHVPCGDVVRAVVGSRAGEDVLGAGMDWGIARIENWRNVSGLDMTPMALATSIPPVGTAVVNPAYTRHHLPYNDSDYITWDNMEWDTVNCGGQWTIAMRTAPFLGQSLVRDWAGCNSRWGAGYIHADCSLTDTSSAYIVNDCDAAGGSSGSPIMCQDQYGAWSVIGVHHGSSNQYTNFTQPAPGCAPAGIGSGGGPSVERFRDAPRFAANVAVGRAPGNPSATAVFAVDSDLNQIVYRTRIGSSPTYTSPFTWWKSLGTPHPGAKLTRIAVCTGDANPQVLVVADEVAIYARSAYSNGAWGSWTKLDIPAGATSVGDIDVASAGGSSYLVMVEKGGSAHRCARTSLSLTAVVPGWGPWSTVASGSFTRITALVYEDKLQVAVLDTAGDIWKTTLNPYQSAPVRAISPAKLPRPTDVTAWLDLDMTWDEAGRGFMIAVGASSDNKLRFTPMYGSQAWKEWLHFGTHVWATSARSGSSPVLKMQSITASTWMEDPAGQTSPVIFGTDEAGNVYFVEYGRVGTPGWILDWKSFYHETIPY